MISIFLFLLAIISGSIFISFSYPFIKKRDYLNPILIVSVSYFISLTLYFFILSYDINYLLEKIQISEKNVLELLNYYFGIKLLSYFILILGIKCMNKIRVKAIVMKTNGIGKISFFLSNLLGLIALGMLINKNGGLIYFVTHLQNRTKFLSGHALLRFLILMGNFSLVFYVRNIKKQKILYSFFLIIQTLGLMCLGGRVEVLIIVICIMVNYYYDRIKIRKRINIFNVKIIFLGIFLSGFIVISPLLRDYRNIEKIKQGNYILFHNSKNKDNFIFNTIEDLSRQYIQIYIIKEFKNKNLELGKTFLVIPKYILSKREDRPPIDDGVYIYNMFLGNKQEYGTSLKNMVASSWPTRTLGNAYINFGIGGIIAFFFILGVLYSYIYRILVHQNYSSIYIIVYFFILKYFTITNIGIVTIILKIFTLFIFCLLFLKKTKIKVVNI